MDIQVSSFGSMPDNVEQYTLSNDAGLRARLITYGATLTELHVPDRNGQCADVVLGFNNLRPYLQAHPYFGSTVGRFANRIAGAAFELNGTNYALAANDGPNTLHGGLRGFDKVLWKARPLQTADSVGVEFSYLSPDMEEGFPGALAVTASYRLCGSDLRIDFAATTDKPTPVNLTNHAYFNLGGAGSGDVLSHELYLAAEYYTPVDANLIPTGQIRSVKGTPLDFTTPTAVGARISQAGGYDHNFVLDSGGGPLALAARLMHRPSGRIMECHTTQPGIQLYTGNFLDGSLAGIGGVYARHYGLCLETQHFPDSVHHPNFPSVILHPGTRYQQTTVYRFVKG